MERKKTDLGHTGEFNKALTACLEECFQDMDSGDPARLARWNADAFFVRDPDITPSDADRLIAALDEEYNKEMDGYPQFHKRRSGANTKPEWHRLPPSQRLGLAQRLSRIADAYP